MCAPDAKCPGLISRDPREEKRGLCCAWSLHAHLQREARAFLHHTSRCEILVHLWIALSLPILPLSSCILLFSFFRSMRRKNACLLIVNTLSDEVSGLQDLKAAGVDVIACVSVNDPFVMMEWAKAQGTGDKVRPLSLCQISYTSSNPHTTCPRNAISCSSTWTVDPLVHPVQMTCSPLFLPLACRC